MSVQSELREMYLTKIKLYPAEDETGAFIKVVGEDGEIFEDGFIEAPIGISFFLWFDELVKDMQLAIEKIWQ